MENLVDLEAEFFKEGFAKGIQTGEAIGFPNGYNHGKTEGHQVGFEIGFALGVAQACDVFFKHDPLLLKASDTLKLYIKKVDFNFQEKEENVENIQKVRARYRVLESRTGLKVSSTLEKTEDKSQDISF